MRLPATLLLSHRSPLATWRPPVCPTSGASAVVCARVQLLLESEKAEELAISEKHAARRKEKEEREKARATDHMATPAVKL
eukprot:5376983-Prymnesium_polylepis.1